MTTQRTEIKEMKIPQQLEHPVSPSNLLLSFVFICKTRTHQLLKSTVQQYWHKSNEIRQIQKMFEYQQIPTDRDGPLQLGKTTKQIQILIQTT